MTCQYRAQGSSTPMRSKSEATNRYLYVYYANLLIKDQLL